MTVIGTIPAAVLLAFAVTIHNMEEMIWLPGFRHPPEFGLEVEAAPFRIAATAIALVFWLAALGPTLGWALDAVIAGLAVAMIVNAIIPHLALSLRVRR